MYVYNYRVFDRYNRPVASLAVLADDDPDWRPTEFRRSLFGCEAGIRFPPVKLLDFAAHEAVLEASANPVRKGGAGPSEGASRRTATRRPARLEDSAGARPVRARLQRQGRARTVPADRLVDGTAAGAGTACSAQEVDKIQEEKRMPLRHEH